MSLQPDQKLSHYRLVEKIGEGGMGVVWRARDEKLRRDVALKVLPTGLVGNPERRRRLLREARAAAAINHPNIATIHEVDEALGNVFIVMELVEGKSLRPLLTGRPLPILDVIHISAQVASGLARAHSAGVVHRDLKPENLIVGSERQVKILDFGLAKLHDPRTEIDLSQRSQAETVTEEMTHEGRIFGTPTYMSPEQARGQKVDGRSDVFSFGVTVYEMATGKAPFHGKTTVDTLSAILNSPAVPPSRLNADVPPELERILSKCLEKDPKNRYQTTEDLAVDLMRLERQVESGASSSFEEIANVPTRRAGLLWTRRWPIAVVSLATIAILAYYWLGHEKGSVDVRDQPSTAPAPPRVTPFLTGEAVYKQPAWSPAGTLIAYVSDEAGNDDIWISDSSGANPLNLTTGLEGVDSHPSWSPDGQRIAFYSDREGIGLYTMTALGADVRRSVAFRASKQASALSWADNETLIYTDLGPEGRKQVFKTGLSAGGPECLTCGTDLIGAMDGDLSPSARFLAFKEAIGGFRGKLYLLDLETGSLKLLDELGVGIPRWSENGERLIFVSWRDGIKDLWTLRIDPSTGDKVDEPKRITSALDLTDFALNPDGTRLLAVKEGHRASLWSFPVDGRQRMVVQSGDQLTATDFWDSRPRWTRDGSEIFFESTRKGGLDVWKLTLETGKTTPLTFAPVIEHRPRIAPDGSWVAFDIHGDRGNYVYLMRPDGSQVHLLSPDLVDRFPWVSCAEWSPDATRLAANFTLDDGITATLGIASIDPRNGTASEIVLLDLPGTINAYPRWSPDGQMLVFEAFQDGVWNIWTVTADGNNPKRITSGTGNKRQPAWARNEAAIYFITGDRQGIWRLPVDPDGQPSGEASLWLEAPTRTRFGGDCLDFWEDRLALTIVELRSDLWLVEFPNE